MTEMTAIAPKSIRVRCLGYDVQLNVDKVSHPAAEEWLNACTVDHTELGEICNALFRHETEGSFRAVSRHVYASEDHAPLHYSGTWHTMPDYTLFCRIFRWWYNYAPDEALTEAAFREAFGNGMGSHYYEKWRSYERSLQKMIGYFGEDRKNGQLFLDMVMEKVIRYENRIKEEKHEPAE